MRNKKRIWLIVCVIALLGAAVCGGILIGQKLKGQELESLYESVSETTPAVSTSAALPALESTEESTDAPYVSPIDFNALHEISEDIYAWIEIPGTNINYPIVQDPDDNTFYLRRSPDGEDFTGGSIFTENYNSTDFTDPNTIIYGHCMRDGTMFAELHNFADADFISQYHEVIIYTPTQELHYDVFAAYPYSDQHLLFLYDFTDKKVFQSYLEGIFDVRDMHSQLRPEVALDADSKIITLSTCMQNDNTRRFLVQAVLTEQKS